MELALVVCKLKQELKVGEIELPKMRFMPKYYFSGRGFWYQRYLTQAYEHDPLPCLMASKTGIISQDLWIVAFFKLFIPLAEIFWSSFFTFLPNFLLWLGCESNFVVVVYFLMLT